MKQFALLLLLLMAALFAVTLGRPEPWAGWLHAFAEAAMVGAIADWFAVVALFRRPLGLPIPHTAIIPRRKDAIGENLAAFVAEHFLHPDVVRARLEASNLAGITAEWLKSPHGHARMVEMGMQVTQWLLGTLHEQRVREFIAGLGNEQLAGLQPARVAGQALDWLVGSGHHRSLLTRALQIGVVMLHDNRQIIRSSVQRGSPWWMPGFIDDQLVVQMLDRIEARLLEMSLDPDHPLRGDIEVLIVRWARELQHAPEYRHWGEGFLAELLDDEAAKDFLHGLMTEAVGRLQANLKRPDSAARAQLGSFVAGLAGELERDEKTRQWVNEWLIEVTVFMVAENRAVIASLISDTVRGWDAVETSQRIERAIGRDLQFIRLNGTLVGGLAGLAIHAVKLA
jgi:uncharacterized membrane-anchored protein YjiN (DUF445 family)